MSYVYVRYKPSSPQEISYKKCIRFPVPHGTPSSGGSSSSQHAKSLIASLYFHSPADNKFFNIPRAAKDKFLVCRAWCASSAQKITRAKLGRLSTELFGSFAEFFFVHINIDPIFSQIYFYWPVLNEISTHLERGAMIDDSVSVFG